MSAAEQVPVIEEAEARRLVEQAASAVDPVWGIFEDHCVAADGYLVGEITEDPVEIAGMLRPELVRLRDELDRLLTSWPAP